MTSSSDIELEKAYERCTSHLLSYGRVLTTYQIHITAQLVNNNHHPICTKNTNFIGGNLNFVSRGVNSLDFLCRC